MKFYIAVLALAATVIASPITEDNTRTCGGDGTVVCGDNGKSGFVSLGNIAPGILGEYCAHGDVYCCSEKDVQEFGLLNIDVNVQCDLAHFL